MAKMRVGISGWTYPGWRGTFYPKDLTQKRELEFASRSLNTIEINGTFYSLQRPSSFQHWYDETPEDFQFSVKAPQFITHVVRLQEVEEPLANFFASGLLCLKEKLGPILWQFPPFVMLKDDRFEKFLQLLPADGKAAARLARQHGAKVKGRSFTECKTNFPVRHAFEFRHPSFLQEDFLKLMRRYNVAFVCAHGGGPKTPYTEVPTADFTYTRLHGEAKPKGYSDREIQGWAKKMSSWGRQGLDSYLYFSNEAKVHAPAGALKLLSQFTAKRKKAA